MNEGTKVAKACRLLFPLAITAFAIGEQAPPPPPSPPPPPRFMTMKGLPLSCFEKPTFTEDGLDFFVCNGGGGIAGVRKKSDPSHVVLVRDPEIAQNLNLQAARIECGSQRRVVTTQAPSGIASFECPGKEISHDERFRAGSKAEWKKYDAYLVR
jgi:hypothetical protein